MPAEKIIAREPLLSASRSIAGYEFVVQDSQGLPEDTDIEAVAACAATYLSDEQGNGLLGEQQIFLHATSSLLASDVLKRLRPQNTFFSLTMAELADSAMLDGARRLRQQGFGISLRDAGSLISPEVLAGMLAERHPALEPVTVLELDADTPDIVAQAMLLKQSGGMRLRLLARHAQDWNKAQACLAAGLPLFAGRLHLSQPSSGKKTKLSPSQSNILELMDLVRKEADIRSLEAVLKRDAAVSFRLLRYINSVGFGLGSEIHSVQHAVTMLGYSTLYKWLALLLATSLSSSGASALMETAVVRGRFAELLGEGLLPRGELENLFVTGMFSLLDQLLDMSMEDILATLHLPESVAQALLTGEGIYGPFLSLVRACEIRDGNAQELADALFLSADDVNKAQFSALVWAKALKL